MDKALREFKNAQLMRLNFSEDYTSKLINKMAKFNRNRLKFNFKTRKIEWFGITTKEITMSEVNRNLSFYRKSLNKEIIEIICEYLAKGYLVELNIVEKGKQKFKLEAKSIKESEREINLSGKNHK